jgi:hypothetical protein
VLDSSVCSGSGVLCEVLFALTEVLSLVVSLKQRYRALCLACTLLKDRSFALRTAHALVQCTEMDTVRCKQTCRTSQQCTVSISVHRNDSKRADNEMDTQFYLQQCP